MYEQIKMLKQNKCRAVIHSISQQKGGNRQGFCIADNRLESIAQRKTQEPGNDFSIQKHNDKENVPNSSKPTFENNPYYSIDIEKSYGNSDKYTQLRAIKNNSLELIPEQVRNAVSIYSVVQRKGTVEGFLNKVVYYVHQLERYSHQGYPNYGKRTRGNVEKIRTALINDYSSLSEEEQTRLNNGDFNWDNVPNYFEYGLDKKLIYFHATNLHLEPVSSVSYQQGISGYHQSHLVPKLKDYEDSNRNYATLYYDITVRFSISGRPLTLNYSGSYAGRSGKYEVGHKLRAPAQRGFGTHQVVSTDYDNQHFQTFVDHHERDFDSEVAVFEDLSQTISKDLQRRGIPHYTTEGNVNLFTDRATCNSCTALAMQFQNAWNVTVNVKHGGVDDYKGYV